MASLGILVFLVVVLVQVLGAAYDRLVNGGTPRVFPEGIGMMAVTLVVNVFVVGVRAARGAAAEERGAARRREAHAQRRADVGGGARRAARRLVGLSAARSAGGAARRRLHRPRLLGASRRTRRASSPTRSSLPRTTCARWCSRCRRCIGCEKIRTRGSADYVVHGPARLARRPDAARVGARDVARGQGPADDAVPAAGGRGHPHRAAAAGSELRSESASSCELGARRSRTWLRHRSAASHGSS